MSRTILYYPNIQIPTAGEWLRSALLYWDNVAAIVPRSYDDYRDEKALERYRPEIRGLYERGIFKPVNPDILVRDSEAKKRLEEEVMTHVRTLLKRTNKKAFKCSEPVFKQKLSTELSRSLKKMGLAEERNKTREDHYCYYFVSEVADIYMALLADYLAQNSDTMTIPSTDQPEWLSKTFAPGSDTGASLCVSAMLMGILPRPRTDVAIETILEFRKKHASELLAFRSEMDAFETALADAEEKQEAVSAATRSSERIKHKCLELERALKGFGIETLLGSIQSLLKVNSPTLWVSAMAALNSLPSVSQVPPGTIFQIAVGGGVIELGVNYFKERHERRKKALDSPFAYLVLARRKRLLSL